MKPQKKLTPVLSAGTARKTATKSQQGQGYVQMVNKPMNNPFKAGNIHVKQAGAKQYIIGAEGMKSC